jgi:hypothetical protein
MIALAHRETGIPGSSGSQPPIVSPESPKSLFGQGES